MTGTDLSPEGGPRRSRMGEFFDKPINRAGVSIVSLLIAAGIIDYSTNKLGDIMRDVSDPQALVDDPYAAIKSQTGEPVKITIAELKGKEADEAFTANEQKNYFEDGLNFYDELNDFKAGNNIGDDKKLADLSQRILDNSRNILEGTGGDKYNGASLFSLFQSLTTDQTRAELKKAGITVAEADASEKGLQSSGIIRFSGGNGQTQNHIKFITADLRVESELPQTPVSDEAKQLQAEMVNTLQAKQDLIATQNRS